MKKALSVVLALIVALSMFSVMAFAGDLVNVKFVVDGATKADVSVEAGTILTQYVPEVIQEYETDTTRYTFKGWQAEGDDTIYYSNTLPKAEADVVYVAVYAEKDISGNQSFWNFIETLFERLNLLFEYFATIFNF